MIKSLHSDEYRKLANWLKSKRESKGLSMRDLAEKMDVPHTFIAKIEARERRLDVIEYLNYCKYLEISPFEGLKEVDKYLK
jgi:transcriptional regulator with XRE-family HTH domain